MQTSRQLPASEPIVQTQRDVDKMDESPPGIPPWVKAFGIIVIVLLLTFAGLHLTGNAPTHMPGSSGAQHDMQAP